MVLWVLLLVIALNAMSLEQMLKFPLLITHYIDHQNRAPSISVMDFLAMHYWGQDINDHDDDRDMELPFKKVHYSQSFLVFFMIEKCEVSFQSFHTVVSYPMPDNDHHDSRSLEALFKPPCLA